MSCARICASASAAALGFGLNSGGTRTYFAQGRLPGGREVKPTIGRHGAPWTTEQARAKAKALLGAMAAGTDPTEAKRSARNVVNVRSIVQGEIHENEIRKDFTPSERVAIERTINAEIERRQGARHPKR